MNETTTPNHHLAYFFTELEAEVKAAAASLADAANRSSHQIIDAVGTIEALRRYVEPGKRDAVACAKQMIADSFRSNGQGTDMQSFQSDILRSRAGMAWRALSRGEDDATRARLGGEIMDMVF